MRVFVTTDTCDECDRPEITLVEVDVARLLDVAARLACVPAWAPQREVIDAVFGCIRVDLA